ncbi:MAG: redoxin domain-containing protein [Ginsengibacter sp.]
MKRTLCLLIIAFFSLSAFSQTHDSNSPEDLPVYLRFPTIPQFTIHTFPDSLAFSRDNLKKNTSTVFFIFSPDCEHCQHETENLKQNIQLFKKAQVVMVSYLPWDEIKKFYVDYNIGNYPEIVMARDAKFFFPTFFKVRSFPSIFVYDKKGNLKKAFEGSVKISTIAAEL